jgi:hypothetical protein
MNSPKPVIFVVQENNRIDYSDAERHGDILFMTVEEYKPVSNSLRNQAILEVLKAKMGLYDPEKDYLVLTGNPVVIGYCFHLAMIKAIAAMKPVKCLQWDRFTGYYREISFPFNP